MSENKINVVITPPWCSDIFNAEIEPKKSIRLHGTFKNLTKGPRVYDLTFKIGDRAEYDSYNFRYTGTIVAIGEKTITIEEKYKNGNEHPARHRLSLENFADRNWDFNAEEIDEYNRIESYSI
jgi:hypothetical protein